MTHTALIRFGLADTPDAILSDIKREGRELYGRMRMLHDTEPVWVNHDRDRQVGRVLEVLRYDDTAYGGSRWVAALCEIEDPPSWLERGTKASVSYKPIRTWTYNGWRVVADAVLGELSLLSPDRTPAEPLAEVVTLRRSAAAAISSDRAAAAGAHREAGEEIHGGPKRIYRPNVGRVLAVEGRLIG